MKDTFDTQFLDLLRDGYSVDDIADTISKRLNEAKDAYAAEQQAQKKENEKLARKKANLTAILEDIGNFIKDFYDPKFEYKVDAKVVDGLIEDFDTAFSDNTMGRINDFLIDFLFSC